MNQEVFREKYLDPWDLFKSCEHNQFDLLIRYVICRSDLEFKLSVCKSKYRHNKLQ